MNSISRMAAAACTLAVVASTAPALAQYANEYTPAKVTAQGKTTHSIAGPGTVTVQVQVNADGTHKAIKVIKSTNSADNDAALEIAQNSSYRPAHRGSTAVPSFYDFVLKFNGKSVVSGNTGASSNGSPAAQAVDAAVRAGHYDDAVSKANAALLATPGDPQLLQLLGAAQYFKKDFAASAAAFNRVDTISPTFKSVAASSFASASVQMSQTNPTQALQYAQKSVAIADNNNSRFALGVAQIANKQYAEGAAALKAVHDKSTDNSTKLAIDRQLLTAYLSTNDQANANAVAAEMKQLDPNGSSAGAAIGAHYLEVGNAATTAKNYPDALKAFQQAADSGDAKVAVTANTMIAFTMFRMEKPDYAKAREYAMKAVNAAPSDPTANFAAGVAWTGVFAGSHSASDKQQALTYLKKADDLAKAANNDGLALQIENQIKSIPQ